MKLEVKIYSKYLTAILEGKKTMEFRQFLGNDYIMLTDETGRAVRATIEGLHEASPQLEATVMNNYKELNWDATEPVIVIRLKNPELMQ
jgi:uncharacterized protein YkvS